MSQPPAKTAKRPTFREHVEALVDPGSYVPAQHFNEGMDEVSDTDGGEALSWRRLSAPDRPGRSDRHRPADQPSAADLHLFASFLGYNPIGHLLGPSALVHLPAAKAAELTGRSYLPGLLTGPFRAGLHIAFAFFTACCLIAAAASWSRGAKLVAAE